MKTKEEKVESSLADDRKAELEQIANDHGGMLKPVHVVEFAKDEETALHSWFEWDNRKAGHAYRLQQARQVIRLFVSVVDPPGNRHENNGKFLVPVYASLPSDRKQPDGGYRLMVDVMAEPTQRQELLAEAKEEFRRLRLKYEKLSELAGVFAEIDKLGE